MKRTGTILLLLLLVLHVTACAEKEKTEGKEMTYKVITMKEAEALFEVEDDYIILDVRRPDEFATGHIPGAINVPNETIGTGDIPELPDKNQLIYVYCRSGRRSKEASAKLVNRGYANVIEFGGILEWKGQVEK